MAARRGRTAEQRAEAADRDIRALLQAGDVRGALHRARDVAEAELAVIRRGGDPARADLLMAALAGSWAAIASTLHDQQPLRPPGYRSGPPSAGHLASAYETARNATLGQGRR